MFSVNQKIDDDRKDIKVTFVQEETESGSFRVFVFFYLKEEHQRPSSN